MEAELLFYFNNILWEGLFDERKVSAVAGVPWHE